MITVFGSSGSTCTRKVLMTLGELGTPYELVDVDLGKREQKGPQHVGRHPFGKIPAIDDDGFTLYESRAICRYLDEKAGGRLVPRDLRDRARMEQWVSVETSYFSPNAMKLVYTYVFGRPQPQTETDAATAALAHALGVLDAALARAPYLVGDAFTLADLVLMPYVEYTLDTPAKDTYAKFPNFLAWWKRVAERPTWRKVAGG